MSVSNISSTVSTPLSTLKRPFEERNKQLEAIGTALQRGDVNGALSAIDELRSQPGPQILSAGRSGNTSNAGAVATDPLAAALDAVASSLGKNDLDGARKALAAGTDSARATGRLRHPNAVPQVSNSGTGDGEDIEIPALQATTLEAGVGRAVNVEA